jgi:hypothetical protein
MLQIRRGPLTRASCVTDVQHVRPIQHDRRDIAGRSEYSVQAAPFFLPEGLRAPASEGDSNILGGQNTHP